MEGAEAATAAAEEVEEEAEVAKSLTSMNKVVVGSDLCIDGRCL